MSLETVSEKEAAEAMSLKSEPEEEPNEYSYKPSVSAEAAQAGLYADHEVRDELVLGPEVWHRAKPTRDSTIELAQLVSDRTREQIALQLERFKYPTYHSGENTYSGEKCSKLFTLTPENEPKKIACDFCTSSFLTKLDLFEHQSCKHGVTNFMCSEVKTLEEHLKSHNDQKYFDCIYCTNRPPSRLVLYRHQAPHTSENSFRSNNCENETLPRHLKTHTMQKRFQCNKCHYECLRKSDLQIHQRIHTDENLLQCGFCDYKCKWKSALIRHLRSHTEPLEPAQFVCPRAREQLSSTCSVRLERLCYGEEHNGIHSAENTYSCEECGKTCRSEDFLRKHIQISHISSKKVIDLEQENLACDFCSSTFQTKLLKLEHEKNNHGVTNFMCSECEYTTDHKKKLRTHLKSHVQNNKSSSCSYSSQNKQNLKRHKRIHTGEKAFSSKCDYKCSQKSNLQRHQPMVHTDKKPLGCKFCNFKSISKSAFTIHLRTHTGEKPFQCSYCSYKCIQNATLQRHMMSKHIVKKPYQCSDCGYGCIKKSELQIHLRSHTGEKPFRCNDCDYKFSDKRNFRRHRKVHTGAKPYKCDHCNYATRYKYNLQRHVGSKHVVKNPRSKCLINTGVTQINVLSISL